MIFVVNRFMPNEVLIRDMSSYFGFPLDGYHYPPPSHFILRDPLEKDEGET